MTREDVIKGFRTGDVNMSDIFFYRNDFTKDELARMLMEVYYEAFGHTSEEDWTELNVNVGNALKDIWEIDNEENN